MGTYWTHYINTSILCTHTLAPALGTHGHARCNQPQLIITISSRIRSSSLLGWQQNFSFVIPCVVLCRKQEARLAAMPLKTVLLFATGHNHGPPCRPLLTILDTLSISGLHCLSHGTKVRHRQGQQPSTPRLLNKRRQTPQCTHTHANPQSSHPSTLFRV